MISLAINAIDAIKIMGLITTKLTTVMQYEAINPHPLFKLAVGCTAA